MQEEVEEKEEEEEEEEGNRINKQEVKGALPRGFRRFLAQTILKLVVANVIHSKHFL